MKNQSSTDERTTLTLLDVAGSCIVDIFYNHLYDGAIHMHERTSRGVTECYREVIAEYVKERSSPKFYSMLLNSIHYYMKMSTKYNAVSYGDFISLYAGLFVPKMYSTSLTLEQKINILSMILGNVVKNFADDVNQQHIRCIIDDHSDADNVTILQNAILDIMRSERDKSYERFINSQKQTKQSKKPTINTTQMKAINKLTDAFKKSLAERTALKKKNSDLTKKNKDLASQFGELKSLFLEQLKSQKSQAAVISKLKADLETRSSVTSTGTQVDLPIANDFAHQDDDELFSVQYVET